MTPLLIEEYVNPGLIMFEFHDFPFGGDMAYLVAEAAWCALDQEKFWEYHHHVMENHPAFGGEPFSEDGLIAFAEELDLDMDAFTPCFESRAHQQDVLDSYADGSALGITSTPTLQINGEVVPYTGWDNLKEQIDAALAAS